jgi:hypothetical protein
MDKSLSFGELCEAIKEGKKLQYYIEREWHDSGFNYMNNIGHLVWAYNTYTYRIKPEPVKRYQWVIRHRYSKNCSMFGSVDEPLTREEAIDRLNLEGFELIEPYLPSEVISDE